MAFEMPTKGKKVGSDVMRTHVLIGVATVGHHHWQFTRSLMGQQQPTNSFYSYIWIPGRPIAEAENIIMHEAKDMGAEFVFMVEEDTIAPADAFIKLFQRLKLNPNITAVAGLYPTKHVPSEPLIYRGNGHGPYFDWKFGEFFEVTGIPMGCTLIRVADLEKMDPLLRDVPVNDYPVGGAVGWIKEYFSTSRACYAEDHKKEFKSNDMYFSEKALEAGLSLWADASVICEHMDLRTGISYRLNPLVHRPEAKATDGKTAIDLGCGSVYMNIHDIPALRVDFREEVSPDMRVDLRDLSFFKDNQFNYVYMRDVLEHFGYTEWMNILGGAYRIAKDEVMAIVPDPAYALELISNGNTGNIAQDMIYGRGDADWNEHRMAFNPEIFNETLERLGWPGQAARFDGQIAVRIFKQKPEWYDRWLEEDKSKMTIEEFWDDPKLRGVKLTTAAGEVVLPVAESVPQEDYDAFGSKE